MKNLLPQRGILWETTLLNTYTETVFQIVKGLHTISPISFTGIFVLTNMVHCNYFPYCLIHTREEHRASLAIRYAGVLSAINYVWHD